MSYNIRYDTSSDGINAWPNRKDHVADMIGSAYQADIAGLQEVLRHQVDELQERLPGYAWVGVGRDDGVDGGEFSPIFYKTERFELLDNDTFWLSETPEIPGSRSWDAALTRIVTWARFFDRETGREFYMFNTHFDHRGEQARIESARLIVDRVTDIRGEMPAFLTGDLNVQESSDAYKVFSDAPGIFDARYVSESGHEGPTASFTDWEEIRSPESRIDYIFVSDSVQVLHHQIVDDKYDNYFPSDHLPVVADVWLP